MKLKIIVAVKRTGTGSHKTDINIVVLLKGLIALSHSLFFISILIWVTTNTALQIL